MRWVVYTLLALNLGVLTWNLRTHGAIPAPAEPVAPPLPDTPEARARLPLLSELEEDDLRARPVLAAAAAKSREAPSSPPPAASTSPSIYGVEQSPGATAPVQTPDAASTVCYTLGPLDAGAPVQSMRSWLASRGASVDVRSDERREVALYWIYFPPRATREEAQAEVLRLRSQGIDDVIAVPKGDMANAISLGVFSRTDTRDRRLDQLNELGYQPSISPRYRAKVATWVDVSTPAVGLDAEEIRARWPAVNLSVTPCSADQLAGSTPAADMPEPPATADSPAPAPESAR